MPNWCYTSYVVTGDEKEVFDLYEKMRSLEQRKESLVENGFGKTWLGTLLPCSAKTGTKSIVEGGGTAWKKMTTATFVFGPRVRGAIQTRLSNF